MLGDRFYEHLWDVERNDGVRIQTSRPTLTICGVSLHQGNTESRKDPL